MFRRAQGIEYHTYSANSISNMLSVGVIDKGLIMFRQHQIHGQHG